MVRMGACRVPDRGSIPRRGDFFGDNFSQTPVSRRVAKFELPEIYRKLLDIDELSLFLRLDVTNLLPFRFGNQ